MRAPLPENEAERLSSLYHYDILDSLPEQQWEDLAFLAAQICETPIAAISFVDSERQWFKAIKGLDARETHRDLAFCAHTILQTEPLVVPNALEDKRFADNALVTGDPHIRFYAGAQIYGEQGLPLGSFCVIDREPRKLNESQMHALSALSRQVTHLLKLHKTNQEFEDLSLEAQKLARVRKEVLSNTSHEMRTPLNAIMGYTQLLQETELTEKQAKYLSRLSNSSKHVLDMVNNILDLSKIEEGEMNIERQYFQVDELLINLQDVVSLSAESKGLELVFDISPHFPKELWGDALRLEQVLLNLLGNAIKFTRTGTVTLKMRCEHQLHYSLCYFEISDTGMGMSPEQLERIFKPFSQADTSISRRFGGTGLGLSISKELVNLMGGELQVQSAPDQGTSISFLLSMPLQADLQNNDFASEISDLNILLVDDNPQMLSTLENYLKYIGCTYSSEPGPEQGIQNFRAAMQQGTPYDLLMVDWQMPGMTGEEMVLELKHDLQETAPKVILMTAYSRGLNLHIPEVHTVLAKPLTMSTLYETLLDAVKPSEKVQSKTSIDFPSFTGKILLAEDNEINQEIMQEYLQKMNIEACIVDNGKAAVDKVLSGQDFDLVLMDIHMPIMDGFEATRLIREHIAKAALPIYALTADIFEDVQHKALQLDMNGVLAKPLNIQELITCFQLHLSSSGGLVVVEPLPLAQESPLQLQKTRVKKPRSGLSQAELKNQFISLVDLGLLDFEGASARVAHNLDLLTRLMLRFIENNDNLIELLLQSWDSEPQRFKHLLHTLKGTAGNLGLFTLQRAARRLEDLPPGADLNHGVFTEFCQVFEQVISALTEQLLSEDHIDETPDPVETQETVISPVVINRLRESLVQLSVTLSRFDVNAAQQIEEMLSSFEAYPTYKAELALINEHIAQFDYPQAQNKVLQFIELLGEA